MNRAIRIRRGLSAVEFVACLSAMVGGVILGSMYLGVDLKRMGVAVLKQAQLIESGDAKTAEAASQREHVTAPAEEAPAVVVASESPARSSTEETQSPPKAPIEAAPVQTPAETPPVMTAASSKLTKMLNREDLISLTDEQRQTLTLAYWEALDACMKEEVSNRLAGIRADGNFTLFDFLTNRKQGHQKAVDFISQLNMRGVDPHVAAYAEKALSWHKAGVTLFGRALDLLTDAPTAQFTGPFAQSWQSASTQHQMEERLLAEKHVAVQDYLDHTLLASLTTDATATTEPAPLAESTP